MIGLTLTERQAAACFCFRRLKQDCFKLKEPYQHQGNIIKQTSLNNVIKQTGFPVVGRRFSIQNNRVSIDENRKSSFIQTNRSFDLSGPIKLATFRMFVGFVVLSKRTDHLISAAL